MQTLTNPRAGFGETELPDAVLSRLRQLEQLKEDHELELQDAVNVNALIGGYESGGLGVIKGNFPSGGVE